MNNTFTFCSPEVSQFLKLVDDEEVSSFVEPLDLKSKEIIILAVNNATDPSQPGGSHWSLLVYTSQVIDLVSISEIFLGGLFISILLFILDAIELCHP